MTNADIMIPRVVDALRSLAKWNLSFFWCGDWLWNKSLAMWLFWAKFESEDLILLVVSFWLLSEESLLRSLPGCFVGGANCVGDLFIVWIGFVGVFCWSIGHCDSLDFLWPLKHLPIVLSVLSTLICNKSKKTLIQLWRRQTLHGYECTYVEYLWT